MSPRIVVVAQIAIVSVLLGLATQSYFAGREMLGATERRLDLFDAELRKHQAADGAVVEQLRTNATKLQHQIASAGGAVVEQLRTDATKLQHVIGADHLHGRGYETRSGKDWYPTVDFGFDKLPPRPPTPPGTFVN